MRRHSAVFAVAVVTCTQQDDRGQSNPAAHGVHYNRARKVVKLFTGGGLDPSLHTEVLVPRDALKEGIDKTHDTSRCNELGPKLRAFSNATRNDGGNGGSESQQEKELHQVIAIFGSQSFGAHKKASAIGDGITHHKINHCGN